MNLLHYNSVFTNVLQKLGLDVVLQPSCLEIPYDQRCWPIRFPNIQWHDNTVAIMHCQDFLSIDMDKQVCPELKNIEDHFGDNAKRVIVVHWNIDLTKVYNGPLNLVYFPTHSYELMLLIKDLADEWKNNYLDNSPRPTRFQCLNGVPRSHRRLVVDWISQNNLQGIVSFGKVKPLIDYEYTKYVIGFSNEANWLILQPIYTQCDVNIVTETMYYECPGIITEKTLMAILGMQVPILIGYKGMVKHFEDLGFDVFRDIVDTDYDDLPDDIRWKTALESNLNILKNPIPRKELESRLIANREHAISTWLETLVQDYEQSVINIVRANFPDLCKD